MAQTCDEIFAELLLAYQTIEPIVEGLEDLVRITDHAESRESLTAVCRRFRLRRSRLRAAIDALEDLRTDGYPILPHFAVSDEIMADITTNLDALHVAVQQLDTSGAMRVVITPGQPEPK